MPERHPGLYASPRKRAVTVELPSENTHSFRYLAAGDYWFNHDSAEDGEGPNNRLHT
ncbi:hypothetical protein ACFCYH_11870 [Streptomyces sp. NPDC056400]|uniref:hypothetical protein n=1 Tax=Streptomyces sp. NPDC056400 TaxID=3345808 RepID=UPI0035E344C4